MKLKTRLAVLFFSLFSVAGTLWQFFLVFTCSFRILKATTQQHKAKAERAYQVMTVWDERMAANAVRFQQDRGIRRMVILAGSSHFDRYFGIPARVAKRTGGKVVTVRIDPLATHGESIVNKVADYIVVVR